ncbi:hypothetical protein SAMN05216570_2535 [Dyella sp. OK004]|uniref:hypothetical protein n=1 Tax=Dyella sp. OK004 TaxID=1855292 RepID=UPI0008E609D8|nr:hypothetical protein [Dyella sp. OK004]SFS11560.1 hypothetical protein SAMN05216570_2535 [Dyella sp. OK004]
MSVLVSMVRLVPAAMSVFVTAGMIALLGKGRYGELSVLMATGALLNGLFFHCSRNLIVYRSLLRLRAEDLGDSWGVGVLLSMLALLGLVGAGRFDALLWLQVMLFLVCISLWERELEYLRSTMDIRGYLVVACARPMWNLAGVALLWPYRGMAWAPHAAFLVVSVSPMLACASKMREVWGKLTSILSFSLGNVARTMPAGVVITLSISYIFVSDALLKLSMSRFLPAEAMGTYASGVDLIMPGCWVLVFSLAWDFAPRLLAAGRDDQARIIVRRSLPVAVLWLLAVFTVLAMPDMELPLIGSHGRLYAFQLLGNMLAAGLSGIVFPAFVAMGRRYTALSCALFGFSLNLSLAYWAIRSSGGEPDQALHLSRAIAIAQVMAATVAISMLCRCIALARRYPQQTAES